MYDLGYLCANFGLPGLLCSLLRPDVHNRQTDRHTYRQTPDVRQHHRLMPPPIRGRCIIIIGDAYYKYYGKPDLRHSYPTRFRSLIKFFPMGAKCVFQKAEGDKEHKD